MWFKKKQSCPDEYKMCACCENAELIGNSEVCICALNGAVHANGFCKKFKFDLLKIKPRAVKIPKSDDLLWN